MSHSRRLVAVASLASIFGLAIASDAFAQPKQKKPSLSQAWAMCKKELDAANVPSANANANARYTAGAACMKKYGYEL
jgi:hypothetical protein